MADNIITYDREPGDYKHWSIDVDGDVARLTLDVAEDGGLISGYKLKLNSYDLGVDMELADALQRIRFEHPNVKVVVITSGKDRVFCAGANINMLSSSEHWWKVNFCKFTNETRNGLEDSSEHSGIKSIAAVNGACAGGGYELALACDEIVMVNDRSSTVSLPEVPLLGVLPGTGGLTRVTDKRRVRRDLADVFCTMSEGVRADRAREWRLIDNHAPPAKFDELVANRARALASESNRPKDAKGIALTPLNRTLDDGGYHYEFIDVALKSADRTATLTVRGPSADQPAGAAAIEEAGADWWALQMTRELDDAILMLRTNNTDIGLWLLKTEGDADRIQAVGASLIANRENWFVNETTQYLKRTLARLDVSSRSLFAIVDADTCFTGILAELLLAADRSYMLDDRENPKNSPTIILDDTNFGLFPMPNGLTRLTAHYQDDVDAEAAVKAKIGDAIGPAEALKLGLVTYAPDDLDWKDEVRIAIEERSSLSPDALTGMEASLRFGGKETMATKVFGRLTAWQNWIFIRPNAIGNRGALKLYGTGTKPSYKWERV
ncbi:MAG: 2,3-epoxybenzoyl-CoA dihydrolase [Rhodospirillaceae bacterium]|nr:2,3-epoxybenzoyl-CoA dihydrolase [Rhodospirillaceae bacterium]MCY4237044.1 2,3-epoxybenzoyl-CoA dihydrolase [Rhodospirillaceae bacterium]MCY4311075.1 2,3-epoxybenzoyl-CoA dihydrolase [Rhodospirillaceae bacterium]